MAERVLSELCEAWGLPSEEADPRAETWLHERRNWQTETNALRAHIASLEGKIENARNRARSYRRDLRHWMDPVTFAKYVEGDTQSDPWLEGDDD